MNEDLVGYLLGALDGDAAERVEKQLAESPATRSELERIGQALRPLAEDEQDVDPPPGLADRTARLVLRSRQQVPYAGAGSTPWRLTDLAVAASILMMFSVVIIPALGQSRERKLLAECSNNLRNISMAMETYAEKHGQYFPFFSTTGPLAVAGMYAPILLDCELVSDPGTFVCPGSGDTQLAIPRLDQLRSVQDHVDRLSSLIPSLGGSYAYSMGVNLAGDYHAPRRGQMPGRSIISDRPARPAEGDVAHSNSPNHGRRGQNVLHLDGSVRFLTSPCDGPGGDNIFESQRHLVEPGRNWDDLVFGSSEARLQTD